MKIIKKIDNFIFSYRKWAKGDLPDWANPEWNKRWVKWFQSKGPTIQYLIMGAVGGSVYIIGMLAIHFFTQ